MTHTDKEMFPNSKMDAKKAKAMKKIADIEIYRYRNMLKIISGIEQT